MATNYFKTFRVEGDRVVEHQLYFFDDTSNEDIERAFLETQAVIGCRLAVYRRLDRAKWDGVPAVGEVAWFRG